MSFYVNDVNAQPALVVTFNLTLYLTFSPSHKKKLTGCLDDLNMKFIAVSSSDIHQKKIISSNILRKLNHHHHRCSSLSHSHTAFF